MKKHIVGIILIAAALQVYAQVSLTEINDNYTQLDFGYQLMMVHFNVKPSDERFNALITGVEMSAERQYALAALVRDEVQQLPALFVTRYVVDNVYFVAIKNRETLGYHTYDRIVLEARGTMHSIRRTFFHEVAHEVADKSENKKEYLELIRFFTINRSLNEDNWHLPVESLYAKGYTSAYSPDSAKEEFCELIADLLVPHEKYPVIDYVYNYPESLMARKVNMLISFFQKNYVKDFTLEYFKNRANVRGNDSLMVSSSGY